MDAQVKVAGLTELRRDLKAAARMEDLAEIGRAFQEATRLVADRATTKATSTGKPADTRLAASYKASRAQSRSAITVGSSSVPWLLGHEFGAYHDRPRRAGRRTVAGWNQFPEIAGRAGRFVYPTIAESGDDIARIIGESIENVLTNGEP